MSPQRKRESPSRPEKTRRRKTPEATAVVGNDGNREQVTAPLEAAPLNAQVQDVKELIRQRAYELYEQRGRKDGYAFDDWVQAEREVTGGIR